MKTLSATIESAMPSTISQDAFSASHNVARMQSSATMAAMQAAEALRAAGVSVCDFGPGEPDFDTPENIKQAAIAAMKAGRTKYTAAGGIRGSPRAKTLWTTTRATPDENDIPRDGAVSGGRHRGNVEVDFGSKSRRSPSPVAARSIIARTRYRA